MKYKFNVWAKQLIRYKRTVELGWEKVELNIAQKNLEGRKYF